MGDKGSPLKYALMDIETGGSVGALDTDMIAGQVAYEFGKNFRSRITYDTPIRPAVVGAKGDIIDYL